MKNVRKHMTREDLIDFWSRVNIPDMKPSTCWEWNATLNCGYGQYRFEYKSHGAHRVSFSLCVKQVGRGKIICHHCDNPRCVRPSHLFEGTDLDNIRDAIKKGRMRWSKRCETCGAFHSKGTPCDIVARQFIETLED